MRIFIVVFLILIFFVGSTHTGYSESEYSSPLKQFKDGVLIENIKCKEYLVLVVKYNGFPACVKPETISKLIDRMWIQDNKSISDYVKPFDGNKSTLLSKTSEQWQNMTEDELYVFYEIYGDRFYTELGKFLIKNQVKQELEKQNITNRYDDFAVFTGGALQSLPPHISYRTIINATDGNSYLLKGGTHANTIKHIELENLIFYDVSKEQPIDFIYNQQPNIIILPDDGDKMRVNPSDLIMHLDKNNTVKFHNSMSVPVRVQDSGSGMIEDETKLKWKTSIIGPNQTVFVSFNSTGHYEWDARFPLGQSNEWWNFHTGGDISVISDETSKLEFREKLKIAGSIIENSEIPWSSLGKGNDKGLYVGFNPAIFHMLPDAKEYYTARAAQLIPFDIPIIIEEPDLNND